MKIAMKVRKVETIAEFLARGGRIVRCKPSNRQYNVLTLNRYDIRPTKTSGNISGTGSRRQKFEPTYLLH
jgi:hypothetical protein